MSSRPVTAVYDTRPLVTPCALEHHRQGEPVVFSTWCPERQSTVKYTGRVVTHVPNGRRITVALSPSGRRVNVECGAVAAASP
ncbi:hypothetical protein [Mycobacterium sp. PSTR-4-N]|uniref:hypothetical protein n=1 Tax=Mycobacterium sp. PSTR-4-N TaxID=2917745 RepID=UPI001F14D969|nr:hypothetical protein [Mycobacterium sp. PSTR-4-N]MCG7592444.1 hypothetical protein [Mycobacterium sp. PSTR-4-N]